MPIVTIGVPAYNAAAHIERTLSDLRAQSFQDFEIVISDNGSSDNTAEICQAAALADCRIRYVRQPQNLGAIANFLFLLDQARGEFFMWAAADDRWHPDALKVLVAALQRDETLAMAFGPYIFMDEEERVYGGVRSFDFAAPTVLGRLARYCALWDDGCFYSLYRTRLIRDVRFPRYYWPNRNVGSNLVYPVIAYFLAMGGYAHVEHAPLWLNRIHAQNASTTLSDRRRAVTYLPALLLRKLNMAWFCVREVHRARGSALVAALSWPMFMARALYDFVVESVQFTGGRLLRRLRLKRGA